jgi:putative sugar O-methyltransferase
MYELNENLELLNKMNDDQKKQNHIYKAGPYWKKKADLASRNIRKDGIRDFRGASSISGLSFSDALNLDIRVSLKNSESFFRRCLGYFFYVIPLINKVFNKQLQISKNLLNDNNALNKILLNNNPRTSFLMNKYKIPFSTLGGPLETVEINNVCYSLHYLNMLDQHDYLTDQIDFSGIYSVFEIGGGFGVNCHLLIENYPNIKKIVYLDIPPNLYTGTQYLKSFYGDKVLDYSETMNMSNISFNNDDDLEIICIAPWQIENFNDKVDLFYNSHSFVEMPVEIVRNYIDKMKRNIEYGTTKIALISYSCFDLRTTFDPKIMQEMFDNDQDWNNFERPSLLALRESNLYFISSY